MYCEKKYTPCGRSLQSLKSKARKLRKQYPELSQRDALNRVAVQFNYANWNQLMNTKNPFDDSMLNFIYKRKEDKDTRASYHNYLKNHNLEDCRESYRKFALLFCEIYEKSGMRKLAREKNQMDEKLISEKIANLLVKKGVASFLPQNLPAEILSWLIDNSDIDSLCSGSGSVNNEAPLVLIVLAIYAHQKKTIKIEIGLNELLQNSKAYYEALKREEYNQSTNFNFEKPTLLNIFDIERSITFSLNHP